MSGQSWASAGPALGQHWANIGPELDQYVVSSAGPVLVRFLANFMNIARAIYVACLMWGRCWKS